MQRFALVAMLAMVGCGESGEPLVATSNLTGSVNSQEFIPEFGVSVILESGTVATVIGTGEIHCGSPTSNNLPPSGTYVNVQISEAVVGVASEKFFSFSVIDGGDLDGGGSSNGSVEVTAVTEETIAMDVSFSDTVGDTSYAVNGQFEAIRCD